VHFDWLGGVLSGDGCQSFMVMGLSPIHESIYNNSRQVVHTHVTIYISNLVQPRGILASDPPPCS